MRLRLPAIVCLLFLPPSVLSSPGPARIAAIGVTGNADATTREVLSWMSLRPGDPFSGSALEADLRRVREEYVRRGYLDIDIPSPLLQFTPESSAVELAITLNEGRRAVVGAVVFAGIRTLGDPTLAGVIETAPGEPLDESILERDLEAVLTLADRSGFPFARCTVDSIVRRRGDEQDFLDLYLALDEGRHMTIDEVLVEGNSETASDVVVRETRIGFGETYEPGKVDGIRPRLLRLGIFADVSEPELYVRNEKGGMRIRVTEGSTNTFDGVLGYVPGPAGAGGGTVTGLVALSMRNLFGTARKFSFRWQRDDRLSQELGVRYVEPWLFGLPVNLGGGFLQRRQDSSYVRRIGDLKGELMVTDALAIGIVMNSESVIPSDTTGSRVFKTSALTLGVDIDYDTRDDLVSPTSGARYRTDYHYGMRRVRDLPPRYEGTIPGRSSIQRLGVDLEVFTMLFPRQVLALALHGRHLQADRPEEGEMYRFGGMRTLRGYREHEFLGSRILWTNAEYRFLVGRRSFLFGFFDAGYYERPADTIRGMEKRDAFKPGYGAGLQVETGIGIVGVSIAFAGGDGFSDAKIHFGLVNDF